MQEESKILEYQKEEAYHKKTLIKQRIQKSGYEESMNALVQYMRNDEKNPSEKQWNQYAICYKYLSSKTMGYLSGIGFNTLCRKLRKRINKEKRQTEE